jgi:acyl-coenzyme A thioesterase PaaI-like protein
VKISATVGTRSLAEGALRYHGRVAKDSTRPPTFGSNRNALNQCKRTEGTDARPNVVRLAIRSITQQVAEPMNEPSLQERYTPNFACFGCGPANPKGLHLRSFARGDVLVADWAPEKHHEAFAGVLNGGIIGTLLDCHSYWAAALGLMTKTGTATPPVLVTAEYSIKMLRPTPTDGSVHLEARVVEMNGHRARVEGTLLANGNICATSMAVFVAVKPGHPAYHAW